MMASDRQTALDWWQSFYTDIPFELYLNRTTDSELSATIDFLWDRLQLAPGMRVFDQCCGHGRLSIPLARRGAKVVGADLSSRFISLASETSAQSGLDCEFHTADAFEFVPARTCQAAFNWWTSFGYSPDDKRNMLMLRRAAEALEPGGLFALDYPNVPWLLRHMDDTQVQTFDSPSGKVTIERENQIDLARGMRNVRWKCRLPDGQTTTHDTSLRLYLPHGLAEMLLESGFSNVEMYGGINGEDLTIDSSRCICLAKRQSR